MNAESFSIGGFEIQSESVSLRVSPKNVSSMNATLCKPGLSIVLRKLKS